MNTKHVTLSTNDKIGLISNMTTLLNAGIPILETVDSLLTDAKGNQKKLLDTMRSDMMQGQRIHTTFAKFPAIFDKVTVNIIKASEEAGTLDEALKDLKDTIKKETEFSDKIRSALIYPLFIVIVFIAVLLMILVVVIPKISTVFLSLKVKLPLPTRVLMFLSQFLLTRTVPIVIVLIVIVAGLILLYKYNKSVLLAPVMHMPVISGLMRDIDLTRFSRSMYLLLNAGLPITSTLELAGETVSDKKLSKIVKHCREVVTSGEKLSTGLKDYRKDLPSIIIKITEAGEKSGSLDKSMLDISEFLDYQVSGTLKVLTSLLEPIMLVMVGVMVGGMMLSIIAPIYSIIGQIG